ncbi:MAG: DUF4271 domain-containing protein [Flavisolibacter sp.]
MKLILVILIMLIGEGIFAQVDSSTTNTDTSHKVATIVKPIIKKRIHPKRDSLALAAHRKDSLSQAFISSIPKLAVTYNRSDSFNFTNHPFFSFSNPIHYTVTIKEWQGKEVIFYSLVALLIFFALIRNSSSRYMTDLFQTYFRTTVRQRNIKDQLVQSPLSSLLFNIFFLLSTGMFLSLLIQSYGWGTQFNFWILFLYCMLGLIGIYGVKYITLKFFGWVFQMTDAIDTYIYIVFSTNKIIGIFLLPFLVILSFSDGMMNRAALTLSIVMVLGLLAYRYFLSFISVQRMIKIGFFHFVLYFCAFEIAPLLLINKLLFRFLVERY